jgi:hypothetical protein
MPGKNPRKLLTPVIESLRRISLKGDQARRNDKPFYMETLRAVADLLIEVGRLANESVLQVRNSSQPGIVKEMITAHALGHRVNPEKKNHDAEDFDCSDDLYEYLAAEEDKAFQLERVTETSLSKRILRNKMIYCSVFSKSHTLRLLRVYEVVPKTLFDEFVSQVQRTRKSRAERAAKGKKGSNGAFHVAVDEKWVKDNGKLVFIENGNS